MAALVEFWVIRVRGANHSLMCYLVFDLQRAKPLYVIMSVVCFTGNILSWTIYYV